MTLDLVGLRDDVVAEARAAALVGREQPAQHADGGGLARTVWSEEAIDRSALHLHREVMHDLAPAERFAKAFNLNDGVGRAHLRGSFSATLTGWPTRKPSGVSVRASIMNTSLLRSSRL